MLKTLQLENWKSFGDGDNARNLIELSPLTLLVGPNASGKSNVLDAVRFLQGLAFDYPLGDVLRGRWEGQRVVWPGIRGGLPEAARSGTNGFSLSMSWSLGSMILEHSVGVDVTDDALLRSESLRDANGPLFDTHGATMRQSAGRQPGGGISAALRSTGKGNSTSVAFRSTSTLLGQVEIKERIRPRLVESSHALRDALRAIAFFDIQPSLMRGYQPESAKHLGLSGENISPVLASLQPEQLQDVVDWLSELCAPGVERVELDRTQLREVMLFLVEERGSRISARSMSDGSLRFLGEIAALLTSPPGSTIVLEEPDVGLHPSRIHLLARLLEHATAKLGVQVIATTHSPTLLAHLSHDSLRNVVVLGRDPESGVSIASRIGDLVHAETLVTSDHLDKLVSTGWLERAL